jgi:hypothetical protein
MSRGAIFHDENAQRRVMSTWTEVDSGTHEAAVATKEGSAGQSHYVTSVHFSFSGAAVSTPVAASLALGEYGDVLAFGVAGQGRDVRFDPPLVIEDGEDVVATLGDGGASAVGSVVMVGFTL